MPSFATGGWSGPTRRVLPLTPLSVRWPEPPGQRERRRLAHPLSGRLTPERREWGRGRAGGWPLAPPLIPPLGLGRPHCALPRVPVFPLGGTRWRIGAGSVPLRTSVAPASLIHQDGPQAGYTGCRQFAAGLYGNGLLAPRRDVAAGVAKEVGKDPFPAVLAGARSPAFFSLFDAKSTGAV